MSAHNNPMKSKTDEELVRLYVESQRNVFFEELYRRYSDKVYRKSLSFVKDQAKAEDFTHDIFLKLITRIGTFQESSKFSTWLFSITYNYCMDQIRITKKMAEEEMDEEFDVEDDDDLGDAEMEASNLRKAMNAIAPEEKAILVMKYQEDFSIKDIADTLKITESAVKMRLKRSREKLKQKYLEYTIFWVIFLAKVIEIFKQI
jgi:RNA polymerase sigma factor (sigma-70 family)